MKVFSLTASACEEASEARLRAFYDRPQAEINGPGDRPRPVPKRGRGNHEA